MNIPLYIDHTLLKAEATTEQIKSLCQEAIDYGFKAVCINPAFVKDAAQCLEGSSVEICTVIGFPLGANCTQTKVFEAKLAIAQGATEIDMVAAIGKIKEGDFTYVEKEVAAVVNAAAPNLVKVILETCLLNEEEIVKACLAAAKGGADFVKTSTGFSLSGATLEAVTLMVKTVGPRVKVKASGGIRTKEQVIQYIAAGAARIGSSSGVKIMQES